MDFNKLRNNGFKIYGDHAYFNKFVYKDIDRLTVDIDLSDNTYTLTVTDMDHDEIYFPRVQIQDCRYGRSCKSIKSIIIWCRYHTL